MQIGQGDGDIKSRKLDCGNLKYGVEPKEHLVSAVLEVDKDGIRGVCRVTRHTQYAGGGGRRVIPGVFQGHARGSVYPRTRGVKTSVLPCSFGEKPCNAAKAGATGLTPGCGVDIDVCSVTAPPWCPFFAPGLKTLASWLRAKVFFSASAAGRGLHDARSLKNQVRSPRSTS